jgi:hypothetical protein
MILGRSATMRFVFRSECPPDSQWGDCALPYYGLTFFQDDCVADLPIRLSLESCA